MRLAHTVFRPAVLRRSLATIALPTLAALGLVGCVVAPVPPAQYGYGAPAYDVVNVPPPAPQYEVVGVAPYPGAIWISGYWNWSGNRHHWVPGRYERPRPGYRWQPHRWDRSPRGGWYLQGGGWVR